MDAKNFIIPGGRSFFLALLALIIASVYLPLHFITEGTFTTIVLGTVGAFIGRAVADDYMVKRNGGAQPPSSLPEGIKP